MREQSPAIESLQGASVGASRSQPPQQPLAGHRHRPHGTLRHYAAFVKPDALRALGALTERDRDLRLRRARSAIVERARTRRESSRPQMRALQASPGMRLRWRSTPAPPAPGPLAAVVHPIAMATCDIDCPLALGASQFALPLHLGHECVAEVQSVGELVRDFKPGDRVIVPYEISCGTCPPCRAGLSGSCASVPPVSAYGMGLATGHWGGAFSDELAVPYADAMLLALPAGVDPAAAASLADNVCDAYRHVAPHLPRLLERDPDAEVLILAGMRKRTLFSASGPLYVALLAKALGAHNVYLVDARPHVRAHAERLGIEALTPRELRGHPRAPLVIDASAGSLALALTHTAADGVCSSMGDLHGRTRIPILQMYVRNVTLHVGRPHVRPLIPEVLELMQAGRFRPELVTTTLGSLEEAPSLLGEHFLSGGVKAVLSA